MPMERGLVCVLMGPASFTVLLKFTKFYECRPNGSELEHQLQGHTWVQEVLATGLLD